MEQEKCQASLELHIFTRCDNISAFKEKGKTNPFGLMLESEAFCSAFIALRCGWEVPDDILPDVEKFVCTLYGMDRKILLVLMRQGTTYFD